MAKSNEFFRENNSHQFLLWDLQSLQFQQHGLNKWICLLFAFKSLHYFQCEFKSCPWPSTGDQLAVSHYTVLTVFVAPCNRMYRSVLHFRKYFLQTCILQLITEFSIDYSIGYLIWLARYHIRFNSRSCGYSSVPGRLFFLHSTHHIAQKIRSLIHTLSFYCCYMQQ